VSRSKGAATGALAAGLLLGAEATARYLPRLLDTSLPAQPVLGIVAGLGYLLVALPAGALHRYAPAAALAVLAGAGGGPLSAVMGAVAGLVAARLPRASLGLGLGFGLAATLGTAVLIPWRPAPVAGNAPLIVLVVLDTVSADSTSLRDGGPYDTTPNLSALAAEGLNFTSAISAAPWTVPSHAAMFTGLLPSESGAHHESPTLPGAAVTTAERLRGAGWRTGAFVANPWVGSFNGLTQGFEHQENHWERARAARSFSLLSLLPAQPSKGGSATVAGALGWIVRDRSRPTLAFVNVLEAHSPFHQVPSPERFGVIDPTEIGERMHRVQMEGPQSLPDFPRSGEVRDARALYAASVHAADALLGELLDGLPDDAFLIVTSDHGEAFGEHGFYGHMVGLHRETLRVPLVISGPELAPGEVTEPVSTAEIHATILHHAGLEAGGLLDGATAGVVISEQLRPLQVLADFQGSAVPPSPASIEALDVRARRVQSGSTVLLQRGERVVRYELDADRFETRPLPVRPEHAALQADLEMVLESSGAAVEIEGDLRAQLRALGYLGDE